MTDRELRKLGRRDLLELLVAQGREQESLKKELEEARAKLEERDLPGGIRFPGGGGAAAQRHF